MLWLKYEQCIILQGDTFEKEKHPLNLTYAVALKNSEFNKLDTSRKLPLLLRSHSHFTTLVIRDSHEKVFHNSVNSALSLSRNKYWLIRGRQSVKSLLQQSVTCKYINAKIVVPPATPTLPQIRLDYNFPYQNSSFDYAGQFSLKIAIIHKRW